MHEDFEFGDGFVVLCDECHKEFAIHMQEAEQRNAVFCPYCGKINKITA